jgi:hypothetical protein
MEILETTSRNIKPMLRDRATELGIEFESCLDVGCGRSRHDRWFQKFSPSGGSMSYIGLETDPVIVSELLAEGVDVRNPDEAPVTDCESDLTLCIEVVEHLTPQETPGFMEFVAANTRKMMVLTTPNFEYWPGLRPGPDLRELRFVPDHFKGFNPRGGPHAHKQEMTPQSLSRYLADAFPDDEWDVDVYRAWPWRLEDLSVGRTFEVYFKLFAMVTRREASERGASGPGATKLDAFDEAVRRRRARRARGGSRRPAA